MLINKKAFSFCVQVQQTHFYDKCTWNLHYFSNLCYRYILQRIQKGKYYIASLNKHYHCFKKVRTCEKNYIFIDNLMIQKIILLSLHCTFLKTASSDLLYFVYIFCVSIFKLVYQCRKKWQNFKWFWIVFCLSFYRQCKGDNSGQTY